MDLIYLKVILLIVMMIIAALFGLVPLKIHDIIRKKQSTGNGKLASIFLSLLSCLAGGVFLGVCLLDLLPFAKDTYEKIKRETGFESEYPLTELIIGAGFFFVYLIEAISMKLCNIHENIEPVEESYCEDCSECQNAREIEVGPPEFNKPPYVIPTPVDAKSRTHSLGSRRVRSTSMLSERLKTSSVFIRVKEEVVEAESGGEDLVKSITFIAAFTFHSTLEGFAFGVQDTSISVATLFFGIIVHKAVVAFSIGMRLVRRHPGKQCFIISLIIFVALTAPFGGAIGMAVQDSKMDEVPKDIVSTILTCIAMGTFLYITFFEILFTEQASDAPKLLRWFSTFLGFAIIALLMLYGD